MALAPPTLLCYKVDMDMISPSRVKTKAPDLEAVIDRALEVSDLVKPQKTNHLKKLTQRHHHLARCLAKGMANWEAAAVTGYAGVTISILKQDPMFKELIKAYTEKTDLVLADFHERLHGLAIDAHDLIRDRMENTPDEISTAQAMALMELASDRIGYGPQSTQTHNHTHGMADRLEAARVRAQQQRQIELKPIEEA
jgi:hypothetical protein